MRIRVSRDAAEFVSAHGGVLYVWVSEAGLLHTATLPPEGRHDWHRERRNGIECAFAPSVGEVSDWRIELRRVPRKHVEAISNVTYGPGDGTIGGGGGVW
jgi:hypothetical protein